MTFDDLKVFVAACESGNLSAVARDLGCTQPAVSQHIARLEKELDTHLLERSPTGVTPTPAGTALRESATESLNVLRSGVQRVNELSGVSAPSLTITTGGTSVRHFLRDSVVRFRRVHPETAVSFKPANTTARCLELLRSGEADLALVTVDQSQKGIEDRVYARQDLRLLVPRDSPLAHRKRLQLPDLANIRYIGLSRDTNSGSLIEQTFSERNIVLNQVMTVDDFDTACVFVELGLGYSIVPAVQAANFTRSARVNAIKISGLAPVPIGLAARRWSALSPIAHAFVEVFAVEIKSMARTSGVELVV